MEKYVLKKAEIEALPPTPKTHFLDPKAKRVDKSLGDLTGLSGLGFHLVEVSPGCESTVFHTHYYEDECAYILAGKGRVRIGEAEHEVSEGDFIGYRKNGLAHTMKNTGTEVLRCIVAGERLKHDVTEYPEAEKRLYRNQGQPWDLVDFGQITHPLAGKK